jgi:hypothetical protein
MQQIKSTGITRGTLVETCQKLMDISLSHEKRSIIERRRQISRDSGDADLKAAITEYAQKKFFESCSRSRFYSATVLPNSPDFTSFQSADDEHHSEMEVEGDESRVDQTSNEEVEDTTEHIQHKPYHDLLRDHVATLPDGVWWGVSLKETQELRQYVKQTAGVWFCTCLFPSNQGIPCSHSVSVLNAVSKKVNIGKS